MQNPLKQRDKHVEESVYKEVRRKEKGKEWKHKKEITAFRIMELQRILRVLENRQFNKLNEYTFT